MPHKQKPTQGRYGREWHDGKAPDGFTLNGWRRIAKGGYIRFCQGKLPREIQGLGWPVGVCGSR